MYLSNLKDIEKHVFLEPSVIDILTWVRDRDLVKTSGSVWDRDSKCLRNILFLFEITGI
jgi:hypothetical protein